MVINTLSAMFLRYCARGTKTERKKKGRGGRKKRKEKKRKDSKLLQNILGNLRISTTALSTTTRSELQCTAQARLVHFVVVVSSTTPNKVESRRPAIHKLRQL